MSALRAYSWPGNVRELQNLVERAAILSEAEIGVEEMAIPQPRAAAAAVAAEDERARLESVMRECKWNKTTAAEHLGISTKTLLVRLRAHGLD
jgi:transcriptional regulator of acetoin/glycerol metabolism